MNCWHISGKINVLSLGIALAALGLGLSLTVAPVRAVAEERNTAGDWVSLPESGRAAFVGIHGGTAPVSVVGSEISPAEETVTGRTGDDFVQLLEGDAVGNTPQADIGGREMALVPFGLGETQTSDAAGQSRLARAEPEKQTSKPRGAVRLKVDDLKVLSADQAPVSPESLLQADELARI